MPNVYLIIMYVLINSTNSDWSKGFSHKWEVIVTDHRPQAVFSISENNRIGFPAFSGAAARQNDWKWILETFAAFQEKTQKCSKHNQLFGGT